MIPRTAIQLQTEPSLRARISPVEIGPERDLQRSNHWSQVDAPNPTGVQWFHQLIIALDQIRVSKPPYVWNDNPIYILVDGKNYRNVPWISWENLAGFRFRFSFKSTQWFQEQFHDDYPQVMTNIANYGRWPSRNDVSFTTKHGDLNHSSGHVYQRAQSFPEASVTSTLGGVHDHHIIHLMFFLHYCIMVSYYIMLYYTI